MNFRSFALPEFWKCYDRLPENTQALADAKYSLFEQEPFHPSLGLKQKGEGWTVDVGRSHRAGDEFHWFWIGSHAEYDVMIKKMRRR